MRIETLSGLLNVSINEILSNPDANQAIEIILCHIGESLYADRAFIAIIKPGGAFSISHEWHNHATWTIKKMFHDLRIDEILSCWYNIMPKKKIINVSDTKDLNYELYEAINRFGIKSFSHYPICSGGKLSGYIGIHYCRRIHRWNKNEIQVLYYLFCLISMTFEKIRLKDKMEAESSIRGSILNAVDIAIYISDLETNRILFANVELSRLFENNKLVGLCCWEALYNCKKRCCFCPIPYLLKNPGKNFNGTTELNGKNFHTHNSLIMWEDGKVVHLAGMNKVTH